MINMGNMQTRINTREQNNVPIARKRKNIK